MPKLLFSVLLAASVTIGFAAAQQEPYPGQGQHAEPPTGWTCSRDAADKAHLCFCRGMVQSDDPMCHAPVADDPDTEEDESAPQPIQEDPKCTVWCHKSHCTCKEFCDT
jgi:hypothetical protein